MFDICLFAGTTEGRTLAEFLAGTSLQVLVCVATDYGRDLLPASENLHVQAQRLDREAMLALFLREQFSLVVDATHPHALAVTDNMRAAAREAGLPCLRLLRAASVDSLDARYFGSLTEAADFLADTKGNILAATGSKELLPYTRIPDYPQRVFVRVLPMAEALTACAQQGIPASHIIAMQGPFTEDLNRALLRQHAIAYLVTKDSGDSGGLQEKLAAAKAEGAQALVIGRPPQVDGLSLQEVMEAITRRFDLPSPQHISVIGLGPGHQDLLTQEAAQALRQADCLIGAKRLLADHAGSRPCFESIDPQAIAAHIRNHPRFHRPAVLFSGDSGFYSGARKLLPLLSDMDLRTYPGISSLQTLCARLGLSWEDVHWVSLHGRTGNIAQEVSHHPKVFVLVGGPQGVNKVCEALCAAGLGGVLLHVGERLSYPEERLISGSASDLCAQSFDPLCALLIEHPGACKPRGSHLPDEAFLRQMGENLVPMTKAEVRAVSVAKLRLPEDAVVYDVGSGTGSVTVEMARACLKGQVYAIECKEEAARLTEENLKRLGCHNAQVIMGAAPQACEALPAPSHAFIGGSGGQLMEILQMLIQKNPQVRIVMNLIALESIAEALAAIKALGFQEVEMVQLQVSRARPVGQHHLLTAQNPVMVITCHGQKEGGQA